MEGFPSQHQPEFQPVGGEPGRGSGTQMKVHQTWFMFADIIRLRRGDEEATADRFAFEQQQWVTSKRYQEALTP